MPLSLALILAPVPLAILVLGCRPSPQPPAQSRARDSAAAPQPIEIRTDRSAYRAGDPLELRITNHGTATLAFNPCTRTLEREQGGGWEPVPEPDRICTMEAWILGPGESRAGRTEFPADLPSGRYRVLLAFTVEGGAQPGARIEASSAPVTVQR